MVGYRFTAICLAICAALIPIARADVASCDERLHYLDWTQKYFDQADAVFLGDVLVENTPNPSPSAPPSAPQAGTMSELLAKIQAAPAGQSPSERPQTATLSVDRSWKGAVASTVTITASLKTDDTGHHPVLRTGEAYLIFAFKDDDGILHVPIGCASEQSVDQTDSKIRVLDALRKPGNL